MPPLIHGDDGRMRGSTPTALPGPATTARMPEKIQGEGPEPMDIESDSAIFRAEPVQVTRQRAALSVKTLDDEDM
eukprot:4180511-Pyramimonas_sp.AAC.1